MTRMMASSTSCKQQQQLHAVAIPLPAQGHFTPLMRFCRRLASQAGFIITCVDIEPLPLHDPALNSSHGITAFTRKQEQASVPSTTSSAASAPPLVHPKLDIRRVSIPMEIPKMRDGSTVFQNFFEGIYSLSPLLEELLSRLIHKGPPITCLISDLFMTRPTQELADKFNIPRIAFHTSNQNVLLFKNYLLEGTISVDEVLKVVTTKEAPKEETFVEGLPGLPSLTNGDLIGYHEDNVYFYAQTLQTLKESKERAHALVLNTIEELEEPGLKVDIGGIPMYAVGPLIEPPDKGTSTSLRKEDKDCILWLDKQPCLSVLYVSFGSVITLSAAQFEEFNAGLISSEHRFLWVFRPNLVRDTTYSSTMVVDLLSKCDGRGYFVEWAPQSRILSHPSVGGFFTHCGWNSTIEAIMSGVPMLCFPHIGDQLFNIKYIIQKWKVGLGFKESKESGLVERDEVERVIRALMVKEEGKLLRKNSKYLKDISWQDFHRESTSSKNIEALVQSLKQGCLQATPSYKPSVKECVMMSMGF